MDRLKLISYLALASGFALLLVGAITVTYVSGWQQNVGQTPSSIPVHPYAQYSTLLMVPGAILVIIGVIYRWKS